MQPGTSWRVVVTLLAASWGGTAAGAARTRPAAPVVVTAVVGSAEVAHPGGKREEAAAGTGLAGGDTVSVAPGGRVDLRLGPKNTIRLAGGTTFTVEETSPRRPAFSLLKGSLLAALRRVPAGGRVTVRTPTGVAGVEGTEFLLEVAPTGGDSAVTVRRGAVELASADGPDKRVLVRRRQSARSARWEEALLRATGTGVAAAGPGGAPADGKPAIVVSTAVPLAGGDGAGPEARASAEKNARKEAVALIVNRLARRRIGADRTIGSAVLAGEGTLRKVLDFAARAEVISRRVTGDGRFVLEMSLDLAGLEKALGFRRNPFSASVRQVSKIEFGRAFGGRGRLMAEGAARRDAQRKLAERIYGVVVDAQTTVRDMAVRDDTVRVRTRGLLRGARASVVRYFSDGTVEVEMVVAGKDLVTALDPGRKGTLGRHYLSTPEPAPLSALMLLRDLEE